MFLTNPDTGKKDEFLTLSVAVVAAVLFRFIVDGLTLSFFGHTIIFPKNDAGVYISLLGPVLGVHGYVGVNKSKKEKDE